MTAPVAAAYMGVSAGTLISRYGEYGRREGGKVFWSRVQLDNLVAQQFDLSQPYSPGGRTETGYDQWKASRLG